MKCGLVEVRKKKKLPPCIHELTEGWRCSIHCRARNRTCRKCQHRYITDKVAKQTGQKSEAKLEQCPDCGYQRRCVNHHIKGHRGCKMHGGKQRVGPANASYDNGTYSRYQKTLPKEMGDRFRRLETTLDYLSLEPDIRAIQAEIEETLAKARDHGESPQAWKLAQEAFNRFIEAQQKKDSALSMKALTDLRSALDKGNAIQHALDHVSHLRTRLQRLVESQRRRAVEHGELVQMAIVINLLRGGADAFKRRLKEYNVDPQTRDLILEGTAIDLNRLTGGAISGVPNARSVTPANGHRSS